MAEQYPKHLYKKNKKGEIISRVVKDGDEEKALGAGWEDSPAKFGVETHPSEPVRELDADDDGDEDPASSEGQKVAPKPKKAKKAKEDPAA